MNWVIDIGNTRIKVALFEGDTIVEQYSFLNKNWYEIKQKMQISSSDSVIVSSVDEDKTNKIIDLFPNAILFSHHFKLPIKIAYKNKLGLDRIAAAVGAHFLYPNNSLLIIDVGSAITFDFLSDKATFLGGNISPGLQFRLKSLHQFTNKLPLVQPKDQIKLFSQTTEEAINSGVIRGICYEIENYIEEYENNYENLTSVLTGGDTYFFARILKKRIFAEEKLVLIGLNQILKYNNVDKT